MAQIVSHVSASLIWTCKNIWIYHSTKSTGAFHDLGRTQVHPKTEIKNRWQSSKGLVPMCWCGQEPVGMFSSRFSVPPSSSWRKTTSTSSQILSLNYALHVFICSIGQLLGLKIIVRGSGGPAFNRPWSDSLLNALTKLDYLLGREPLAEGNRVLRKKSMVFACVWMPHKDIEPDREGAFV